MALIGTASFSPAANNYFYIKPSGTSGWLPLEVFYERRHTKNKKILFTHEMLKKCKFKYRELEYKYEALENKQVNQLEHPHFYTGDMLRQELFCLSKQKGYKIRLLETLDRYIRKARYETIKAATIIDIDYLNSDSFPKPYYWLYLQRCFYAENAIYSYYATYEILALMAWIGKGYYLEKPHDTFQAICEKCHSSDLRKKLPVGDLLIPVLCDESRNINEKFAKVRKWCNAFKHRGILRFEGEKEVDKPTTIFVPNKDFDDQIERYSSSDREFEYLDLDKEVLPTLIDYHENILYTICRKSSRADMLAGG